MRIAPLVVGVKMPLEIIGATSKATGITAGSLESSALTFLFRVAKCTKGASSESSSDASFLAFPTNRTTIVDAASPSGSSSYSSSSLEVTSSSIGSRQDAIVMYSLNPVVFESLGLATFRHNAYEYGQPCIIEIILWLNFITLTIPPAKSQSS